MCGIAGYYYMNQANKVDIGVLKKMTNSIAHRGPDGEGYYMNKNIGFGHRRLAIIDIKTGDQPMFSEDRSIVIVFNGEIYNYIEIKEELKKLGYHFRTESDTEVILNAYHKWGIECVGKFNGVWAFAIWDKKNRRLFCSRDRLGEKPFFYAVHNDTFIFGSEIKALFQFGIPKIYRWELLDIYLSLTYIPAPHTFFKYINKLLPGHSLLLENGHMKFVKYWDAKYPDEQEMRRDEQNIFADFEELFNDAVRIRMRSDVPYGAFLSGGLDSGSVVATMTKFSHNPVKTCTIGFQSADFDERRFARLVAKKFNTDHIERTVKMESAENMLNIIAHYYDEPFGDPSSLPMFILTRATRERVKMNLSGDGGDEILCGYTVYQGEKFSRQISMLPKPICMEILSPGISLLRQITTDKVKQKLLRVEAVLKSANKEFVDRFVDKQPGFRSSERNNLLVDQQNIYPVRDYIADTLKPVDRKSNYTKINYWLLKISLPDDMLCKVDRVSMANSIEVRAPFLDYRLVELMAKVHMDVKMKHFQRKYILRQTIARQLPRELLSRHKQGFSIPLRDWYKKPNPNILWEKTAAITKSGRISLSGINTLLQRHRREEIDVGNALWSLAVLACVIT